MNVFSDLLAIEYRISVRITLCPIMQNGAPCVRTICNDRMLFQGHLLKEQTLATTVDLLEPIDLSIELSSKKYCAEKETAVIIKSVMIDDFDIVPAWTHLAAYKNDKDNTDPTSYLGFNGIWQLAISEPFYLWRHRITGQGWLLEPITAVRDCVPSSANTIDGLHHNDAANTSEDSHRTRD